MVFSLADTPQKVDNIQRAKGAVTPDLFLEAPLGEIAWVGLALGFVLVHRDKLPKGEENT